MSSAPHRPAANTKPTPASALGSDLSRLWQQLGPRRRVQFWALVAFMLIGALAEVATLGAIVPFLALLSQSGTPTCSLPAFLCALDLVQASALFAAMAAIATVVRISLLWSSNRFTYGLGADLGSSVFHRLLHQPYTYHVARNTSEAIAGINKVNQIVQSVIQPLMQGFVALALAVAILVGLLWIDARSAIAAILLFGTLYVGASAISRRMLRRNGRVIADCEGQRIQAVQEGLGGIRDILIDGTQDIYGAKFDRTNLRQRRAQASNAFVRAAPRYIIEGVGMILMVLLALWIHQRDGFAQAIPVLGALALGSQKLLPQMQQVYTSWASVNGNLGALRDVLALLELPSRHVQPDAADAIVSSPPADAPLLELRQVTFAYAADRPEALRRVNLILHKGERLGVMGTTGSGKSTLIDLCMGLLKPTTGQILVEGDLLDSENERKWHKRIAHVPQNIFLADGTIAENIAFGVPPEHVDHERLRKACRIAQLDEVIAELPQGTDTWVGERGIRLSGGQRQRIGLARALYKKADVLILDEATSALDTSTESAVMAALVADDGTRRTMIVIAHRLSTLSQCDRVIEVRGGTIVRQGSYQDVVSPATTARQ